MGKSEFGFYISSPDEFKKVIEVINQHNEHENFEEVGEELIITAILKYTTNSTYILA